MRKAVAIGILVGALALVLGACARATPTPTPAPAAPAPTPTPAPKEVRLTIMGGVVGGAGYMAALGLNQVIAEKVPGIVPTVQGTPGYVGNAKRMAQGLGDIAVVVTIDLNDILAKRPPYENAKKFPLQMYPVYPPLVVHFMVRQDSGITSMSDLQGKRINLLTQGSLAEKAGSLILDTLGIKPASVTHYPHSDAVSALLAGDVDAVVAGGTNPAYADLALKQPIRVLSLTEEEAKKIQEKYPRLSILEFDFSKVYKGTGKARVVAPWGVMAARHDLDPDLVYTLTKAVYENYEIIARIYKPSAPLKPEMVVQTLAPLHPGALRYYQEIGVQIPQEMMPPSNLP